MIQFTQIFR